MLFTDASLAVYAAHTAVCFQLAKGQSSHCPQNRAHTFALPPRRRALRGANPGFTPPCRLHPSVPGAMGNTAGVAINNPTVNVNPVHTNVTTNNVSVNVSVNAAEANTAPTVMAGAAGGAALGAVLAGPGGALVGAAIGAGAGMVRVHMGRQAPAPAVATEWLPDAALAAIAHSAAASGHTTCAVCLDAQTAVALAPCGHACLCGACTLRIRRAAGAELPLCPVCRVPATGCHRVYLT
jgi:hypothetical protein